jgi:uncharacterized protein YejL (UPF0352 family)
MQCKLCTVLLSTLRAIAMSVIGDTDKLVTDADDTLNLLRQILTSVEKTRENTDASLVLLQGMATDIHAIALSVEAVGTNVVGINVKPGPVTNH